MNEFSTVQDLTKYNSYNYVNVIKTSHWCTLQLIHDGGYDDRILILTQTICEM